MYSTSRSNLPRFNSTLLMQAHDHNYIDKSTTQPPPPPPPILCKLSMQYEYVLEKIVCV